MKRTLLFFLMVASLVGNAQLPAHKIEVVSTGQDCSIRGLSVVSNEVVWLSGSKGHVGRSVDGGKSWKWIVVPGYEQTDFRDIHAFDANSAVIMGIGNPAYILKTNDGGASWKLVYTKDMKGMFLDAMDFKNDKEGICIGDPIDDGEGNSRFFVIRTSDGGDSWREESVGRVPVAENGEAVFSASGTNIALLRSKAYDYSFISGGLVSNLYLIGKAGKPNKMHSIPIIKGKETTGAFSMATDGSTRFYCIGGDYKDAGAVKDNFVWTTDNGASWKIADTKGPRGYRSCIRIIEGNRLIACGTNGVDVCDGPEAWTRISTEGFNVCGVSPNKKLIFFAGDKGKIGLLRL